MCGATKPAEQFYRNRVRSDGLSGECKPCRLELSRAQRKSERRIRPTPIQRLEAKLERRPNGCWNWTGLLDRDGYGKMKVDGKTVRPHRFAYENARGPIPCGLELDHLCRNPRCANPDHLEAVDTRTNTLRGTNPPAQNARKTHCKRGHLLTGDNLRMSGGSRVCRTCRRASATLLRLRSRQQTDHTHAD